MKIVVIDSATCSHGGLSWRNLHTLGDVLYYPRTSPEEIIPHSDGATCILTNMVPFSRETIARLPSLKYIGVTATGYNIIDVDAAREAGIAVTNVPAYSSTSVTQHVFALILENFSRVNSYHQLASGGAWAESNDFCLLNDKIEELAGQTIGIIGYGDIGKRVAKVADAFGMSVLISSRSETGAENQVPLKELLKKSDIVTLHCPLFPETKKLVDRDFLQSMKSSAILINTSRGGLIDEDALHTALSNGIIRHACLDVLETEPPKAGNRLLSLPNITVTPHVAWGSDVARQRLIDQSIENLLSFLGGGTRNRVV